LDVDACLCAIRNEDSGPTTQGNRREKKIFAKPLVMEWVQNLKI
jgi:hypothetical protein